jgi:hypothetical protein
MRKAGKKWMSRLFSTAASILITVLLFPGLRAEASGDSSQRIYDVVFRSGNKGTFQVNVEGTQLKAGESVTLADGTVVTMNDDQTKVVYKVAYGAAFPDLPTVVPAAGYVVNTAEWDAAATPAAVEGKEEMVAKYLRLVDGVEYTVKYVDENGVDVASPIIATANKGDTVTARAKSVSGYYADSAVKTLNVTGEGLSVSFVYKLTNPPSGETIEQIVEEVIPGGTVVRENVIEQVVPGEPAAPVTPPVTPVNPAPVTPVNPEEDVNIPEPEVPQAPEPETSQGQETQPAENQESQGGEVDITEPEVPMAEQPDVASESNLPLYLAGGAAVLAVILAAVWFLIAKKKQKPEA